MRKVPLTKYLLGLVGCVFLLNSSGGELSAQDWSIKQLKNSQHPILETTGKQFDFRDEVLGHVVAELETDFVDDQLHLNILARSPRIGGYRSYRHVHGSNRMTARVLRRMVDGVSLLQLRDQTGHLISTTLKPTDQKLLERRLNLDGSMNYLAMTQQDFIVQLEVVSEPLSQGSYQIDLFLESQLRLQIKFQINERLQAVSFHSALHFVAQPQSQTQQAVTTPQAKLNTPADWQQRDFEGKFFLLSQAIKRDVNELPRWVDFLFEQKEYRLLEQVVLTQPGGFDCNKIGPRLAEVSAPNWPRLTYWATSYGLEHTNISPSTVIGKYRDTYYSWCAGNQIEIHADIKYEQQNVDQYWGKLDPKDVFANLEPSAEVTKFTGKTAIKGKFYLQQFERAVLTLVNWRATEKRTANLLALLKHPDDELRKQVMLAYTHLRPRDVAVSELLAIANGKADADSVREMATLAASYGFAQKVCDDINAIAAQEDHPGWKPAVSRLGDIGTGYDLKVLREQTPRREGQSQILERSIKLIVDREAALRKIWQSNEHTKESSHANARLIDASSKMARLVEARLQKRTSAEPLQQWTTEYFKTVAEPSVVVRAFDQLINQQGGSDSAYTRQLKVCAQKVLAGIGQ